MVWWPRGPKGMKGHLGPERGSGIYAKAGRSEGRLPAAERRHGRWSLCPVVLICQSGPRANVSKLMPTSVFIQMQCNVTGLAL